MRRRLGREYEVFSTGTKEGLDALEREYSDTKTRFEKWRATECQHILTEFQNSSSDLKRDTLDRLQNQLEPSPISPIIGPLISELKQGDYSAAQLNQKAREVQSACLNLCTQAVFEIQGQYNQQMRNLIAETAKKLGQSCAVEVGSTVQGVSLPTADSLHMHLSGFAEARTALFGGLAGGIMAPLLVGMFFPPAGAAAFAAQLVVRLLGALLARRDFSERNRSRKQSVDWKPSLLTSCGSHSARLSSNSKPLPRSSSVSRARPLAMPR
jgi:hypothetical protein